MIIISAPSGAGKTTLVKAAIATVEGLVASVSHTTRRIRPGEVDGEDYFFIDVASFKKLATEDAFLEHANVFGNLYGTSDEQIRRQLGAGRDIILEIDWQGARRIQELYPTAVSIFVLPPSEDELRRRLEARGGDSVEVIEQRMREAVNEISHAGEYDFLVVNDEFERAAAEVRSIIAVSRLRTTLRQSLVANWTDAPMASS